MPVWMITLVIMTLLLAIVFLWLANYYARRADNLAEQRFYELLKKHNDDEIELNWINRAINRMHKGQIVQWLTILTNEETTRLLRQAGWSRPNTPALFEAGRILLPIVILLLSALYLLFSGIDFTTNLAGKIFIVTILSYLLPVHIVRRYAKHRSDKIVREMPTVLHILRMLFDAGLSLEQTLDVLRKEGETLTPEFSKELNIVLKKIDAGQHPAEALGVMAAQLEIKEVTDTVAILKQVSLHGGNIRQTLQNFSALMEERQLSKTREYINVLSGKMSLVMMLFLFPALLIFLAGPGFIALAEGLLSL